MYLQCTTATIRISSDLFYGQQNKQPPQGAMKQHVTKKQAFWKSTKLCKEDINLSIKRSKTQCEPAELCRLFPLICQ